MTASSILVVDDEPRFVRVVEVLLRGEGYGIETATSGARGVELLGQRSWDLVLTDLQMPNVDGIAVLDAARKADPELPVIIITAHGTIDSAVAAIRSGAFDYVEKPFDGDGLKIRVERALEHRRLRLENRRLRHHLAEAGSFQRILGESRAIGEAIDLARRVAPTDSTVLLLGESGTGKELFARAVHEASRRAGAPFVKINCAAIPSGLLEAELFGVEKGAFTGAGQSRPGKFEEADGGTLFLDEIGELEPGLQPKLLRALEDRIIERLGGGSPRPVDVRVVAATNRDLEAATAEGGFRQDLYHRIAVFTLRLPPLRSRREDVPVLARAFVTRFNEAMGRSVTEIPAETLERLAAHPWTGNVRELANAIERAMILASGTRLEADLLDLRGSTVPALRNGILPLPEDGLLLEELEGSLLRQALERTSGNKTRAARLLGLTRGTLRYRLEKHGLE